MFYFFYFNLFYLFFLFYFFSKALVGGHIKEHCGFFLTANKAPVDMDLDPETWDNKTITSGLKNYLRSARPAPPGLRLGLPAAILE